MSRDEKNKPAQSKILGDKELDSVNGGGFYFPVSGCPNGYTKLVSWFGVGVLYDGTCRNCGHLKESGGMESGKYCEKVSGKITWE